ENAAAITPNSAPWPTGLVARRTIPGPYGLGSDKRSSGSCDRVQSETDGPILVASAGSVSYRSTWTIETNDLPPASSKETYTKAGSSVVNKAAAKLSTIRNGLAPDHMAGSADIATMSRSHSFVVFLSSLSGAIR